MSLRLINRVSIPALAWVLAVTSSLAQEITMNVGFGAPQDSAFGRFGEVFQEKLEEKSGGAIKVKLRCCNQISSEDEAFKAMQMGMIDGFIVTANNVSPHWQLMDVTVLPYVFKNTEHMNRVLYGDVGQMMKEKLHAETSVHLLAFGPAQFRDMYNSSLPIETISDFEGLKIRVPKNEVMIATYKAFGANPIPLAWSETQTALQTNTVDGGDNATSLIRDMKFYEYQAHLTILEHFVAFAPLFASDVFMKKLTPEQRAHVTAAAVEASEEIAAQTALETEYTRQWLVNEGKMSKTVPDRTSFIAAAQTVQQEFAKKHGAEFVAILNAIQAAAD